MRFVVRIRFFRAHSVVAQLVIDDEQLAGIDEVIGQRLQSPQSLNPHNQCG
jgi:hypothetical protein